MSKRRIDQVEESNENKEPKRHQSESNRKGKGKAPSGADLISQSNEAKRAFIGSIIDTLQRPELPSDLLMYLGNFLDFGTRKTLAERHTYPIRLGAEKQQKLEALHKAEPHLLERYKIKMLVVKNKKVFFREEMNLKGQSVWKINTKEQLKKFVEVLSDERYKREKPGNVRQIILEDLGITEEQFLTIVKNCPKLRTLDIQEYTGFTSKVTQAIARHCPNFNHIIMSLIPNFQGEGIEADGIFESIMAIPTLKKSEFYVNEDTYVFTKKHEVIANLENHSSLEEFSFIYTGDLDDEKYFQLDVLLQSLASCKELKHVKFVTTGQSKITQKSIRAFHGHKKLQRFEVITYDNNYLKKNVSSVGATVGLEALLSCPKIETIVLEGFAVNLTEKEETVEEVKTSEGVETLRKTILKPNKLFLMDQYKKSSPSLKRLVLNDDWEISDSHIEFIYNYLKDANGNIEVEALNIPSNLLKTKGIETICKFTKLKELDLSGARYCEKKDLALVLESLKSLERLNIGYMDVDDAITQQALRLPKLKELILDDADEVTDKAFKTISQCNAMEKIRFLNHRNLTEIYAIYLAGSESLKKIDFGFDPDDPKDNTTVAQLLRCIENRNKTNDIDKQRSYNDRIYELGMEIINKQKNLEFQDEFDISELLYYNTQIIRESQKDQSYFDVTSNICSSSSNAQININNGSDHYNNNAMNTNTDLPYNITNDGHKQQNPSISSDLLNPEVGLELDEFNFELNESSAGFYNELDFDNGFGDDNNKFNAPPSPNLSDVNSEENNNKEEDKFDSYWL